MTSPINYQQASTQFAQLNAQFQQINSQWMNMGLDDDYSILAPELNNLKNEMQSLQSSLDINNPGSNDFNFALNECIQDLSMAVKECSEKSGFGPVADDFFDIRADLSQAQQGLATWQQNP